MAFETGRGKNEIIITPNAGMNEITAVTAMPLNQALLMHNFRLAADGMRIEKRDGLTAVADATFTNDVYGYTTYYNPSGAFCQLAICEDKIWRRIESAAWAAIHTWTFALTHPLKVREIQGKQFIINETENKMILPDGTLVQVGITPPTTIPTLAATFDATLLTEDCADISDWTDNDAGAGASTQATFDGKSCMRLLNGGAAADVASRYRTITGIGPEYGVEFGVYFNTLETYQTSNHYDLTIYNGRVRFKMRIDSNDVYIWDGTAWVSAGVTVHQDKWILFKVSVNTSVPKEEYCEVFMDGVSVGEYWVTHQDTTNAGKIQVDLYGATVATDAYLDYINVGSTAGGKITGMRRYAVAFARSGNYGNLSNPIKSLVGSKAFVGSGLNDMTPGGTYTADINKNIRVQIDAVGATDTMKWSEDNGATWGTTGIPLTKTIYLSYGIELVFGATTGHTLNDYWNFTCSALAVDCVHQKVGIASIPVSEDPQVDQRYIFRTLAGGETYFLVAIINDNATTTFVDNFHDSALGADMEEDNGIAPLGKYSAWWDDRMWIFDDVENIIYYSKINNPEAFDKGLYYISVRMGESDDKGTGLIPYKSYLYAFKQNSAFLIRKRGDGTYGRYESDIGVGNRAPWSLIEANGLLMFLSERGWEVFNGDQTYPIQFSKPMDRTFKTIDDTKLDLITAVHYRNHNEVWLNLPDRTGGLPAKTIVCNYLKGAFYTFGFHKTPSSVFEARDASKRRQLYLGTRDGYVFTCDSGMRDGTTNIEAQLRLPWIKGDEDKYWRHLEIEHECPTGNTLTLNMYIDMKKTTLRTKSFTGSTPSATDQDYRWPIKDNMDMALRGQYAAIELLNSENVGSQLKVNELKIIYQGLLRKKKKAGD